MMHRYHLLFNQLQITNQGFPIPESRPMYQSVPSNNFYLSNFCISKLSNTYVDTFMCSVQPMGKFKQLVGQCSQVDIQYARNKLNAITIDANEVLNRKKKLIRNIRQSNINIGVNEYKFTQAK